MGFWLVSGFRGLNFQLCTANEEEKEVGKEEEKDAQEGEEGHSQRSNSRPMAASVDPEIHKNLVWVKSPFDTCCQWSKLGALAFTNSKSLKRRISPENAFYKRQFRLVVQNKCIVTGG